MTAPSRAAASPLRHLQWPLLLGVLALIAYDLRGTSQHQDISDPRIAFARFELDAKTQAVGLTVLGHASDQMWPATRLTDDRHLLQSPGSAVTTPFGDGTHLVIETQGGGPAPYVVIAPLKPPPPGGARQDESPPRARIDEGFRVALTNGQLALEPWVPDLPWRVDGPALERLRDTCAIDGQGQGQGQVKWRGLELRRTGSQLELKAGRCASSVPLPASLLGKDIAVAVAAGPAWARTQRLDAPFVRSRSGPTIVVLGLAVLVLLVRFGFGALVSLQILGVLAVAGVWIVGPAALLLVLSAVTGFCLFVWRVARPVPAPLRALFLVALFGWGALTFARRFRPEPFEGSPSRCLVLGYSMARGVSLRGWVGGVYEQLSAGCGVCRDSAQPDPSHGTGRYARPGGTFEAMAARVLLPDFTMPPGGHVAFVGAANDDFFWSTRNAMPRLALVLQGDPDEDEFSAKLKFAQANTWLQADEQIRLVAETSKYLSGRGLQFVYLHDSLAMDMAEGRSPTRVRLLERRRAAVEEGGGRFIDFAKKYEAQMGVAWWNDFIHLSEVGHARMQETLCAAFAEAGH